MKSRIGPIQVSEREPAGGVAEEVLFQSFREGVTAVRVSEDTESAPPHIPFPR